MPYPLIEGRAYIVNDVSYCIRCGAQAVNVSGKAMEGIIRALCWCGSDQNNQGLAWHDSRRFARLTDLEAELKTAVENEDYETAAMIRDIKI